VIVRLLISDDPQQTPIAERAETPIMWKPAAAASITELEQPLTAMVGRRLDAALLDAAATRLGRARTSADADHLHQIGGVEEGESGTVAQAF